MQIRTQATYEYGALTQSEHETVQRALQLLFEQTGDAMAAQMLGVTVPVPTGPSGLLHANDELTPIRQQVHSESAMLRNVTAEYSRGTTIPQTVENDVAALAAASDSEDPMRRVRAQRLEAAARKLE